MRIFRKKHKYKLKKIIIKSDILLEETEVTFILNTIKKVIEDDGCYEPSYYISSLIYNRLSTRVLSVETNYNSRIFRVYILK